VHRLCYTHVRAREHVIVRVNTDFFFAYLFTKYELVYCDLPIAQGNGYGASHHIRTHDVLLHSQFFDNLFNRSYAALLIFQVACIGIFTAKLPAAFAPLIVLLIITVLVYLYTRSRFRRSALYVNQLEANKVKEDAGDGSEFAHAYEHPSLREDPIVASIKTSLTGTEASIDEPHDIYDSSKHEARVSEATAIEMLSGAAYKGAQLAFKGVTARISIGLRV
jgi:hypothetical protein